MKSKCALNSRKINFSELLMVHTTDKFYLIEWYVSIKYIFITSRPITTHHYSSSIVTSKLANVYHWQHEGRVKNHYQNCIYENFFEKNMDFLKKNMINCYTIIAIIFDILRFKIYFKFESIFFTKRNLSEIWQIFINFGMFHQNLFFFAQFGNFSQISVFFRRLTRFVKKNAKLL